MHKKNLLTIPLLLLLLLLSGCTTHTEALSPVVPASAPAAQLPPPPTVITLTAVGDNLLHNTVYQSAQTAVGYDFLPLYAPVAPYIAQADVAFVNQEAPMSGGAPSSYPCFNSPQEAGRDLTAMGFDVINLANNHILDKGGQAVLRTLDYLDTLDCAVIGAHRSTEARQTPVILERSGITLGFIGYTYGTNGIPLPKGQPDLVSLIDRETITQEVTALRHQCDFVIVSMHWGNEYQLTPSSEQEDLAKLLADLGADIVIGTHPHVIQPAQWLEAADGGHRTFVAYSLGNFISSQSRTDTMLGGMLTARLQKTADDQCTVEAIGLMPLVTHFEAGAKNYRVYPLDQYTPSLAQKHRLRAKNSDLTIEHFTQLSQDLWGEFWLSEQQTADLLK